MIKLGRLGLLVELAESTLALVKPNSCHLIPIVPKYFITYPGKSNLEDIL